MLVSFDHDTRTYHLEEVLSEEGLWLGRREFSNTRLPFFTSAWLVLNELTFACFHAIYEDEAQVVALGESLEQ